jgi:hypothetical protein
LTCLRSMEFTMVCAHMLIWKSCVSLHHLISSLFSLVGFSGCHRYEAHQRLGLPTIRCKIRRGTKETLRFTFDLLSIFYDLHQTLLISNLILLFPFYSAGITSAESWYEVFSKWLTCNLVWKSLLSWTAVLLLQVITRVISISHIYRCYSLYILSF